MLELHESDSLRLHCDNSCICESVVSELPGTVEELLQGYVSIDECITALLSVLLNVGTEDERTSKFPLLPETDGLGDELHVLSVANLLATGV